MLSLIWNIWQLTNIVEEEERQGSRSSQDKDTLEDKDKDKDKEDKDALEVEVVEEKEGKQTRAEDLKLNQVNPGPGNPMLDSKEPPKEFESIPVKEAKPIEETEVETELKQQPKEESESEIEAKREEDESVVTSSTKRKVSRT